MKRITILLITLAFCVISFADQRGVTFEKDGLKYTIASEYIIWHDVADPATGEMKKKSEIRGEVYVSGVTVSDTVVKVPVKVTFPSSYSKSEEDTATYYVLGIGEKAFEGAVLKDLSIPYDLKFIGDEAFRNMTITNGMFIVQPARRMGTNLFEGVNAKVLITGLNIIRNERKTLPIVFDKTFENTENLPEIYISHSSAGVQTNGINKQIFYTVGKNIIDNWLSAKDKADKAREWPTFGTGRLFTFNSENAPYVTIRIRKKFEKTNKDIGMLPPYEYQCWNPYTQKRHVYQEFAINNSIYRGKTDDKYLYFTTDGKPITNIESLLDSSGKDPFGRQVISAEELKEKKSAKEREKNLNKKLNDLKSTFGF